jgi:alpha-galactosidase
VSISCDNPGSWSFKVEEISLNGVTEATVLLTSPTNAVPPLFEVTFTASGTDVGHVWVPVCERSQLFPYEWGRARYTSELAKGSPIAAAFSEHDTNRLTASCDEALRYVEYGLSLGASDAKLYGCFRFFKKIEAPIDFYRVKIRIDERDVFWSKPVEDATAWIVASNGFKPAYVPEAAFDPLYSTWYAFWQDVTDKRLEKEFAPAAELGMKTFILDDGWQIEKPLGVYGTTGDWLPAPSRFPDMKGHVAKAHKAGLKYLVWAALPKVGHASEAYKRFKGKFLLDEPVESCSAMLDPRFPEVREYLAATFAARLRDWDLDGLKLDFIDNMSYPAVDPAIAENFAGRDIKSIPHAVDVLMKEVLRRISEVKKDALVEFRQHYIGPAMLQYGNIFRSLDCPNDLVANRRQIADLRLTSMRQAVHADMLVWNRDDTPENAGRMILSAIFAAVQYSMQLDGLKKSHRDVIRHWIAFANEHREALLKGEFRPHHHDLCYPWIESWSAKERIAAVYCDGIIVPVLDDGKKTIVLNASSARGVAVEMKGEGARRVELRDVFGRKSGETTLSKGIVRLDVPESGYAIIFPAR